MAQRIDQIVDGEASCSEKCSFYVHMALCWKCRRYLRQFRQMRALVGKIKEDVLPDDFYRVIGRVIHTQSDMLEQHIKADPDGVLMARPVWIKSVDNPRKDG
jgi:hypothetical protein